MNNFDEKINYLLAEIDSLTNRVRLLEKGGSAVVDDELKDSPNAIQNSVVFSALLNKADISVLSSHADDANNPHAVTKTQVGLSDADNTADSIKSVLSASKLSTARTIANVSFDGSANIDLPFANLSNLPTTLSGYGITDAYTKTQTDSAQALKANLTADNLSSENVTSWRNILFQKVYDTVTTSSLSSISISGLSVTDGDILRIYFNGTLASNTDFVFRVNGLTTASYNCYGLAITGNGSPTKDDGGGLSYFKAGYRGSHAGPLFTEITLAFNGNRLNYNCVSGQSEYIGSYGTFRSFVGQNGTVSSLSSIQLFALSGNINSGARIQVFKEVR